MMPRDCALRIAVAAGIALGSLSSPALASRPREIIKTFDDVTVRLIMTEAVFGRLYVENIKIREDPEMCEICERMAMTADSLLWIPVGIRWTRDGGLLIDPVIELIAKGRVYRSCEAWAGRPTRSGLITVRAPVEIPPGWECEPQYKDWKGISVYVAFPRQIRPAGGGWPLALHLEEVLAANVRIR
jgi:hypothetical protein